MAKTFDMYPDSDWFEGPRAARRGRFLARCYAQHARLLAELEAVRGHNHCPGHAPTAYVLQRQAARPLQARIARLETRILRLQHG